jgi:hypothetical protein
MPHLLETALCEQLQMGKQKCFCMVCWTQSRWKRRKNIEQKNVGTFSKMLVNVREKCWF